MLEKKYIALKEPLWGKRFAITQGEVEVEDVAEEEDGEGELKLILNQLHSRLKSV